MYELWQVLVIFFGGVAIGLGLMKLEVDRLDAEIRLRDRVIQDLLNNLNR